MIKISNIKYQISNIRFKIIVLLAIFVILFIPGISSIKNISPVSNVPNTALIRKITPVEPTPAMKLTANLKNLPGSIKTYQIKPAPFEIFGTGGQTAMAKALGFTSSANTYTNGGLVFYLENGKTLAINSLLGTITYNNQQFNNLTIQPSNTINQDSARQKVLDFFQSIKLSSLFWGWESAKITAFDKNNNPTALISQTVYFRLEPTLKISEFPLAPPHPILADVENNGVLRYFSFWYPNLASDNSKIVKIPNQRELQKMINAKNTIILGPPSEWPKTIDNLKLIYEVPKFLDFTEPVFLGPTLIFTNGKATVKFKL